MNYRVPFELFQNSWSEEAIVTIDANAILDLYRCSTDRAEHILKVLDDSSDRIWLTSQVVTEFERNRRSVIKTAKAKYEDVTDRVKEITLIAQNSVAKRFIRYNGFRFPQAKELGDFINAKLTEIEAKATAFESEISEEIRRNNRMLIEDQVKPFVEGLVSDEKVGVPFDYTTLIQLYMEGATRYLHRLPPGYEDIDKDKKDETKTQKFGDLIFWKQFLYYARENDKPFILVTNETKKDWWVQDKEGNLLRPRDELITEFAGYNQNQLIIMNLSQFIAYVCRINNTEDFTSKLEDNANDIIEDFVERKGWDVILDDSLQLTYYLIHSGELQSHLDNTLSDVEIISIGSPSFTIDSVEVDDQQDKVVMEGTFETKIESSISQLWSSDQEISVDTDLLISGSISFEFDIDFEETEEFIKQETLVITVGGFSIEHYEEEFDLDNQDRCINCSNLNVTYTTNNGDWLCESCSTHYEICPDCGLFFEEGTLRGALCSNCDNT